MSDDLLSEIDLIFWFLAQELGIKPVIYNA